MGSVHRGKQGAGRREATTPSRPRESAAEGRSFAGRASGPYSEVHERVFEALSRTQEEHRGEAVHLEEVARASDLPPDETSELLHDLVTVHGLATELAGSDSPDMGARFEVKPRT
ncbi:hypothetical protein [Streptomyces sp. ID05-47C]|uniref:hypothetical protein n=1 Tax=Streptomyces sp. ID05-47C TaxID=3028665 RepID=UPI0029BF992C|nr:hypothetical protein [Streptomyces sp. ID05-47C]MDX3570722.1 hypothetical protein [Streptomyces sp. ID05-47C]